jgi:hypothetical protein
MADEKKENPKHNKSIDVTKPKKQASTTSHIDTSRVSAYTLREQQSLEKLKKQVGNLDVKESKASTIKTIVAIVLILILIAIAIAFVIVIGRTDDELHEDYDMRLSMQIENKSSLSIITEAGLEQLREINPGDKIPLRATVRNSSNILGDSTEEGAFPPAIFIRFKLVLILDYEERYDIMIPTMDKEDWYSFDATVEGGLTNGIKESDHYYYYMGSLTYMQPEELFSSIEFSGDAITCDDGGKYGQIQVKVESVEANLNNILSRTLWPTAPQAWLNFMLAQHK